ncbi:MAG: pyridoxal-phosphate dependent enzyme, partial [Proteobacteria bacterium]|nr:pyridoxal-phosphate dependent enzyme [Pseudomonadota bacterium]
PHGAAWHDVRVTKPPTHLDGDPISLGEGNTPVIRSRWLGPHLGLRNLWFKLEQVNPTGSYKDRFAARFVTRHHDHGHPFVLATSSGNTGASLAAYSAAAGLPCIVCVPVEAPEAKLVQIRAYGARIVRVRGMLDTPVAVRILIDRLATVCASFGMPLGTSAYEIAPEAMAGIEPLGAELADVPSGSPDRIFAPIGGGGLLTAIFRGLPNPTSLTGHANRAIRIHGVQPSGNDTVVGPLRAGKDTARTLGAGEAHTAISGLGVPIDLDATRALHAIRSTGGDGHLVADTSVWDAQAMLARHEGLFIEPAGSTSVAGLIDAARAGQIGADDHVICVLTGHGFKDGPASIRLADHHPLDPDILDATDLTGEYFARILN